MIYWSRTNWEDSLYGGFERVLRDLPTIKTDFNIRYEHSKKSDLAYYYKTKLADLFQYKVKEFKYHDYLLASAKLEEGTNPFTGQSEKHLVVDKEDVIKTLNAVKLADSELASLFDNYEKEIINTKYYYDLTDFKDDDGDVSVNSKLKKAKENAKELISKTSKYESKYTTYGKKIESSFEDLKRNTTFFNIINVKKGISKVSYNSEETIASSTLVNLLDVNFDPKRDKVENLRNGKLDIAKIATVPSGNTRVYYTIEENISTKPFSVCILMDESGSMCHSKGKKYQHSLVKILYKAFSQILPKDKIYIYGHSGDEESHENPEIRIYHDPYNQNFEDVFEAQNHISFNENYDGIVIEKIYDKIRSQTSESILFISISDGVPSGSGYGGSQAIDEMKRIIEKCRRDGFVTVGIGFDYDGVKDIYSYSTTIENLSESPKLVSTLLNKVVKLEFQDNE
jgi:hypothetical protein